MHRAEPVADSRPGHYPSSPPRETRPPRVSVTTACHGGFLKVNSLPEIKLSQNKVIWSKSEYYLECFFGTVFKVANLIYVLNY